MKIFLNKNTHVGIDEPADKTKTWLPQNLTEEANFLSNPATYGVLSGPRVKIAEGLDAQNIDAYGEKFRVYEVEPSTLVVKEYKNGAWVDMELDLGVPETEDALAGTWVFKDTWGDGVSSDVNFTSNGETFDSISSHMGEEMHYFLDGQSVMAYMYGWQNEAYKTITITSKLSEVTNGAELLTWLKANATKQGAASLITFTIDGTSYQAEESMTWGEWVESEYNTNGFRPTGLNVRSSDGYKVYGWCPDMPASHV